MSDNKGSEVHVTNLKMEEVTNEDQIENMIRRARKNRAWAKTLCNERSSRSHSVFRLRIEGHNSKSSESCCGTLNLVSFFVTTSLNIKFLISLKVLKNIFYGKFRLFIRFLFGEFFGLSFSRWTLPAVRE